MLAAWCGVTGANGGLLDFKGVLGKLNFFQPGGTGVRNAVGWVVRCDWGKWGLVRCGDKQGLLHYGAIGGLSGGELTCPDISDLMTCKLLTFKLFNNVLNM